MKAIAISGSPRQNGSTEILLKDALSGAAQKGFETKMVRLYDLAFQGCQSCFACKVKGSPNYGKCVYQDGLKTVLEEIHDEADVLFVGSPIYWWDVTGQTRSFVERVFFPLLNYADDGRRLLKREIQVGGIYTMNVTRQTAERLGYQKTLGNLKSFFTQFLGPYEEVLSYDAPVFFDYEPYVCDAFDQEQKAKVRETQFPLDKQSAFELGMRLAQQSMKNRAIIK